MRIAFLLNQFPLLSETFILNQVTGLIDRGHHVDVYMRGTSSQAKRHPDVERYGLAGINLFRDEFPDNQRWPVLLRTVGCALKQVFRHPRLAAKCARDLRPGLIRDALRGLYPVAEFLDRGPYDVVHAHYGINGLWALRLRRAGAFQSKVVVTMHGAFDVSTFVAQHGRHAYKELFETADRIMAISENLAGRLRDLGCPPERLTVHRVGVKVGGTAVPSTPAASPLRVVSVARLVDVKGIEIGVQAISRLVKDFPDLQYEVAGDGPLRHAIHTLIMELGLESSVRLLGWQDQGEVHALLDSADVLLAPSVTAEDGGQEGLPTALMEAMAAGLPVVATGYSGTPELVRNGLDGRLTPERNVEAVAEALREILRSEDLRRTMGKNARQRVSELHDINTLNERLIEIYRDAGPEAVQ